MARKASVRYWTSRKAYCCWINGVQVTLAAGPDDAPHGPTYLSALAEFSRLTRAANGSPLLEEVVEQYTAWLSRHRKPSTAESRVLRLQKVCRTFGQRYASTVAALEVEEWASHQRDTRHWSACTIRGILSGLKACLRWAVGKGLLKGHQLDGMEIPRETSRGIECVLTPDQEAEVIDAARRSARDLVTFLRDTGCRPGEAAMAEARHFHPALPAIVLPNASRSKGEGHKTDSTGKDRVIYLRGESKSLVPELCRRHPTGPLFRSSAACRKGPLAGTRGGWTGKHISELMQRLRRKTGIQGLIAYSFRHGFAVQWLRAGKPIAALAEVMGTSIAMIQRHYGHLADQRDYLAKLVEDDGKPIAG